MPVSALTTEAKIRRLLSPGGVSAFADHDGDGAADDNIIDDSIGHASEMIVAELFATYETAQLVNSTLIQYCATVIACLYLCEHRGNNVPASIAVHAERVLGERGLLARIRSGKMILPDVRMREGNVPQHANLIIDRRFARSKIRRIGLNSGDEPSAIPTDDVVDIIASDFL